MTDPRAAGEVDALMCLLAGVGRGDLAACAVALLIQFDMTPAVGGPYLAGFDYVAARTVERARA